MSARACRTLATVLLLGVLAVPAAVRGDEAITEVPDAVVAALDGYDLESRWAVYAGAVRAGPEQREAWIRLLRDRDDTALLEWIALYDEWRPAAGALAKMGAPEWVRVAVWGLFQVASHDFEHAAIQLMRSRPEIALAWLEAHPDVIEGPVRKAYETLTAQTTARGDPKGLLPPLDPKAVFRHLDAPAHLDTLERGDHGEAGSRTAPTRWRHQVVRAVHGYAKTLRRWPEADARRAALLGHPDHVVRREAVLSYAGRRDGLPYRPLLYLAADPLEPLANREAAILAMGTDSHPAVADALARLARSDDGHVARVAAIRLADDAPWASFVLGALAERLDEPKIAREVGAERERRVVSNVEALAKPVRLLRSQIETLAWMRASGSETADVVAAWMLETFRPFQDDARVVSALSDLAVAYEPDDALLDRAPDLPGPEPARDELVRAGRAAARDLLEALSARARGPASPR